MERSNDNLNDENNGGIYLDGDVMHIIPINTLDVETIVNSAKIKTRNHSNFKIIIDPVGKYTMQELIDAKDRVFDEYEKLGILSAGTDSSKNSITVGAEKWTDEKKQAVRDIAGVDNIIFEVLTLEKRREPLGIKKTIELSNQSIITENPNNLIEPRAVKDLYVGDLLIGDDVPIEGYYMPATLGACVIRSGGTKGYITTFHGEGQSKKVYRRDSDDFDTFLGNR